MGERMTWSGHLALHGCIIAEHECACVLVMLMPRNGLGSKVTRQLTCNCSAPANLRVQSILLAMCNSPAVQTLLYHMQ